MSWTDIVNKGSSTWWIVQNNQPAGSGSFADAVPDVDDWNTLSDGKQGSYRFPLKRTPGIDIEFALRWEYTNQYRGKGMFLRTIWTDVSTCNVPDGFQRVDLLRLRQSLERQPEQLAAVACGGDRHRHGDAHHNAEVGEAARQVEGAVEVQRRARNALARRRSDSIASSDG